MPLDETLLDAVAGVIAQERDRLREQTAALIADVETHKATATLDIERAVNALTARLATLKDGEPGPPGPPGRDTAEPDVAPIVLAMMEKLREDRLDLDEKLFAARQRFERLATEMEERIATLKDGEPGPPGEPGPMGEPGHDGLTGEARGKYDPNETYRKLDRVSFNGSEWIAKMDDPGTLPGDGWMLGAMGKKGRPGVGIETAAIVGYALVFSMSDGKTMRIDLRPLFERYHDEVGQ